MKKRVLALMLVLGMTFSLAACGSSNDKKSDDTKTETADKDSKEKMTTVKWNYGSSGKDKAEILKKVLYGAITPEVPASILQLHNDVTIVADEAALSEIDK